MQETNAVGWNHSLDECWKFDIAQTCRKVPELPYASLQML